ncbi:16610_t:CDS:2 [Dentiscutata erythropus]|uniref:16610_t:CDS:1 n=1 Tax=Dentiscutata erythropus TaxID=1348616 RepID=A0A9N9NU29_9GLOM|nr:16610_t:CDS:2 [Dentiscutata erythropus]
MDSSSAAVSSEICEQEVDYIEISKRDWQSNELDKYMPQDPQDNYQSYEPNKYRSEFNLEEEVPTSSNYYSESSITASGTRNAFDLTYTCKKQSTRISEYDKTDSFYSYEQVLPKCQKTNVQDESVKQSSDTSKSSKFEEIYLDKVRHGQCNIEMADKKPCDAKVKTGDSTTALWKHLKIVYGYSKMIAQQLNKKQTTITRSFETFLSKPHSITEQAIHNKAITKSENNTLIWTQNNIVTCWNSTYNAWVRMLKLKSYIEIFASLLTVQQEKDAITDRKRLKAIMIAEDE